MILAVVKSEMSIVNLCGTVHHWYSVPKTPPFPEMKGGVFGIGGGYDAILSDFPRVPTMVLLKRSHSLRSRTVKQGGVYDTGGVFGTEYE